MRAEEYLGQIKKIDAIISNKSEEYIRLTEIAAGLGGFSVGDKVKSSRNLQQIPNAIVKYVDIEREINELKRKRDEIIKTIEQLPYIEYKVIYMLYVGDSTYKEIAYEFGMSYEWVKKHRKMGLRRIQGIIGA